MLLQLLDEIRNSGTVDAKSLAARLEITPQMIEALLEHLRRAGYLRLYQSCASACLGCSHEPDCAVRLGNAPRLWSLGE